ncbi:hypothetical protein HU735_10675 [Pseudomonas sp. BW16M2]|uniref:hypothetical protein n=1 Tax=Pseudomonas sp. BW16M2 TaxID=2745489 RepID=UPI00164643B9|nr:hypothetical protein [Pseudomonas sp. BW16M2]MBC3435877.1 hypothetical protein [Pseudomonas sp. BW16M2]
MFKLTAKYLALVGVCTLANALLYLNNQWVFYKEGEEFYYLGLIILGLVLVALPAGLLWGIGVLRRELVHTLHSRSRRLITLLACSALALQASQAVMDNVYLDRYGLSEATLWSSGSENFNLISMRGKALCTISTKTGVHFEDVNGDGFADMFLERSPPMHYLPERDTFDNCPSPGG